MWDQTEYMWLTNYVERKINKDSPILLMEFPDNFLYRPDYPEYVYEYGIIVLEKYLELHGLSISYVSNDLYQSYIHIFALLFLYEIFRRNDVIHDYFFVDSQIPLNRLLQLTINLVLRKDKRKLEENVHIKVVECETVDLN